MRILIALIFLTIGGLVFWAPTVTIELVTKRELPLPISSVVPLVSMLLGYLAIRRSAAVRARSLAIWMLAGIYMLGPVMMLIGWKDLGGSGIRAFNITSLAVASIFPLMTLYMAGPDGTLFAVLLVTGALLFLHFRVEQRGRRS